MKIKKKNILSKRINCSNAKIRNGTKIKLVALVPRIKNDGKGKKVRKFARLPSQDPLTSFFLFYLVSLLGSLYAPSSFHER